MQFKETIKQIGLCLCSSHLPCYTLCISWWLYYELHTVPLCNFQICTPVEMRKLTYYQQQQQTISGGPVNTNIKKKITLITDYSFKGITVPFDRRLLFVGGRTGWISCINCSALNVLLLCLITKWLQNCQACFVLRSLSNNKKAKETFTTSFASSTTHTSATHKPTSPTY